MDHGDDDALGAGHEIHRATHARDHLARNRPVGEQPPLVDLKAAKHGDVDMAAADQAEREATVEATGPGNGANEAAARVGQILVLHPWLWQRLHANEAVFRLEEYLDPSR